MRSAECRYFRCSWCGLNALGATVVTHPVDGGVVDHAAFVDIRDVDVSNIIDRAVVAEGPVVPIPAFIAGATIPETVVDATVEADMRTPVADIPGVGIAAPTPITGRPEQANFGSHYPRTRHPEVALITISPVAGRPQITVARDHGLRVHR